MKENVALRVLSEIMQWDNDRARREFAWLSLMSRMKYDGYRDFLAGVRFTESLADWLQQFGADEREIAYQFIRKHLVYFGPAEMQHLVELAYPEHVRRRLVTAVAQRAEIPRYLVWAHENGVVRYQALLRRTLFLGLSDGARMDTFRRVNVGIISNEQIVVATEVNPGKWESLIKKLREDTGDPKAQFEFLFLMDDFVGSGKTLLREAPPTWEGKLIKFWKQIQPVRQTHFSSTLVVCVHHYVSTNEASRIMVERRDAAAAALGDGWFKREEIEFSFGTVLPPDLPIDEARFGEFMKLVKKYYDEAVQTQHTNVGGTDDVRLGFGGCALPLVLEHNTPNNSVALLWADTVGANNQHAMRPLFRRRQRHV